MKKITGFILLKFIYLFSFGQVQTTCGTVEPPNSLVLSPQASKIFAEDNTIRTIPLVFHVVWNPSLFPNDSAMAAGRINAFVNIMQKFTRKQNADTAQTVAAFRGVMADAKIEFCLKQVIFKRTTETNFTTNDKIKYLPTGSPAVDPLLHCNIWLGRLTGSLGGYAYFPSSTTVGQPFDGLVAFLHSTASDEQIAEVIVHELLHYLHVYHTFSNSCTGDGDFCADTPPTNSPSGCQLTMQKCNNLVMVQNVMDYAHCATGLTKDQSARMTATLIGMRNELWNSGTCGITPPVNMPPVISITYPANGQTFTAPTSFFIKATATDDGFITKVEFRMNNVLVFTDNTFPYEVAIGVPAGTYILTARAYDNTNLSTTSAPITITVNQSAKEPILEQWIENNRHYIRTARKTYSADVN